MRGILCCVVMLAGCYAQVAKHAAPAGTDAAAVSADADAEGIADQADPDAIPQDAADADVPANSGLVACTSGAFCDNGLPCLDTANGAYCASLCVASCPAGWQCQTSSAGGDVVSMCVPRWVTQCDPCHTHDDCKAFDPLSLCLPADETDLSLGKFCSSSCDGDHKCATGMACSDVKNPGDGTVVKLCMPSDGVCPCSPRAKQKSLSTPCSLSNPTGSCAAVRSCGPDGLSPCTAPLPAKEKCNGLDDDCNGKIDDGICNDNDPCTIDTCDAKSGGCVFKPAGEGAPCEDGSACTVADACKGGVCSGIGKSCDDGNLCTTDACDPKTANCLNMPAGATPCDDGDACTSGDTCSGTVCQGAAVACDDGKPCTIDSCSAAAGGCVHPASSGGVCDDGSACTTGDECAAGECVGTALVCDDSNPCTDDGCEAKTGCTVLPNTATCTDGDACTQGDACTGGKCIAGSVLACDDGQTCTADTCAAGACQHAQTSGSCVDGNACTVGDACGENASGTWTCLPGSQTAACDDANACTDDACDPLAGCKNTDNSATVPCWTGPPAGAGIGVCHGGIQVCAGGKPAGGCVGEVLPAASESCNGLDDDCNGSTDEGCKAVSARLGSAWLRGGVAVDKLGGVRWGSGGGAHGTVGSDKYKVNFGLLRWLLGGGK